MAANKDETELKIAERKVSVLKQVANEENIENDKLKNEQAALEANLRTLEESIEETQKNIEGKRQAIQAMEEGREPPRLPMPSLKKTKAEPKQFGGKPKVGGAAPAVDLMAVLRVAMASRRRIEEDAKEKKNEPVKSVANQPQESKRKEVPPQTTTLSTPQKIELAKKEALKLVATIEKIRKDVRELRQSNEGLRGVEAKKKNDLEDKKKEESLVNVKYLSTKAEYDRKVREKEVKEASERERNVSDANVSDASDARVSDASAGIPEAPAFDAPAVGDIPQAPAFDAPAVDIPQAPAFDAPEVPEATKREANEVQESHAIVPEPPSIGLGIPDASAEIPEAPAFDIPAPPPLEDSKNEAAVVKSAPSSPRVASSPRSSPKAPTENKQAESSQSLMMDQLRNRLALHGQKQRVVQEKEQKDLKEKEQKELKEKQIRELSSILNYDPKKEEWEDEVLQKKQDVIKAHLNAKHPDVAGELLRDLKQLSNNDKYVKIKESVLERLEQYDKNDLEEKAKEQEKENRRLEQIKAQKDAAAKQAKEIKEAEAKKAREAKDAEDKKKREAMLASKKAKAQKEKEDILAEFGLLPKEKLTFEVKSVEHVPAEKPIEVKSVEVKAFEKVVPKETKPTVQTPIMQTPIVQTPAKKTAQSSWDRVHAVLTAKSKMAKKGEAVRERILKLREAQGQPSVQPKTVVPTKLAAGPVVSSNSPAVIEKMGNKEEITAEKQKQQKEQEIKELKAEHPDSLLSHKHLEEHALVPKPPEAKQREPQPQQQQPQPKPQHKPQPSSPAKQKQSPVIVGRSKEDQRKAHQEWVSHRGERDLERARKKIMRNLDAFIAELTAKEKKSGLNKLFGFARSNESAELLSATNLRYFVNTLDIKLLAEKVGPKAAQYHEGVLQVLKGHAIVERANHGSTLLHGKDRLLDIIKEAERFVATGHVENAKLPFGPLKPKPRS